MAYNNPTPDQSTILSAEERSREARKLLQLLGEESDEDLQRRLTPSAYSFVQQQLANLELLEGMGSKTGLGVTVAQLHYLRDSWAKFA